MHYGIVRKFGALLLVSGVWVSTVALPVVDFAQEALKPADSKSDAKKSDKKGKNAKEPKASPTPASTTAPLGSKEDPSQIGKRNINKGTDKFFGWLGGSREKEMAIGRQMAMQVEQQAK